MQFFGAYFAFALMFRDADFLLKSYKQLCNQVCMISTIDTSVCVYNLDVVALTPFIRRYLNFTVAMNTMTLNKGGYWELNYVFFDEGNLPISESKPFQHQTKSSPNLTQSK